MSYLSLARVVWPFFLRGVLFVYYIQMLLAACLSTFVLLRLINSRKCQLLLLKILFCFNFYACNVNCTVDHYLEVAILHC
jgi:hypothetical protein